MVLGGVLAMLLGVSPLADACDGKATLHDSTPKQVQTFVRSRNLDVLTFAGYSGAGYQDRDAMLAQAKAVLSKFEPRRTLVNIGATEEGIGAVYDLAKGRGFATIGIVSVLAREEGVALSKCVDDVFFVRDTTWGGRLPGSSALSPTSTAIVQASRMIVGIGGGAIARDEMTAARRAGKRVIFVPADMDHERAREAARAKGQPPPTDFHGAAHAAFCPTRSAHQGERSVDPR
jgi:hypothetical protein